MWGFYFFTILANAHNGDGDKNGTFCPTFFPVPIVVQKLETSINLKFQEVIVLNINDLLIEGRKYLLDSRNN